ncbi:MAG: T9SS type A sorting domain-containing protein [Flavobacteriales bacterium]|nr:T9SS type A sorting domain-containing protein [Flavobacteriales bacterium]MBK9701410.1 T9SS type A sorting domain-containing protein [Flavobacteriales bacterium]
MRPVPGGGGTDLVVHCYDTLGNQLWNQQLSIGDADSPRDLSIASDGTVFCIGTGTAADGSKDLGAFGISASGTLLWSHVVDDGPLDVLGSGIAAQAGGSCVLVGTRADPLQGGRSAIFTQRLDPSGQPLWSDLYTTPNVGNSGAHDVILDAAGDILVHGHMRDTTVADEILVLKYAQETGLSEEGSTGSFMTAWPNPATDRVQIAYAGLHAGSRLRLTDALGRVVAWGRSGMPHLELVALPPGLYDLACVDERGMVLARCPLVIGSH